MVKKGYKWHQLKKASTRQNKVEGFLAVILLLSGVKGLRRGKRWFFKEKKEDLFLVSTFLAQWF